MDIKIKYALYILHITLWAFIGFKVDNIYLALLISFLLSLALLISRIDLGIHIIPNELVLTMIVIGILLQLVSFDLKSFLIAIGCMIGMGALFLITAAVIGFDKVGAGDVKLAGAIGLVLGYPDILTALIAMSAAMILYCAIGFSAYKLTLRSMLPFAPFMMIGMITGLISNLIA